MGFRLVFRVFAVTGVLVIFGATLPTASKAQPGVLQLVAQTRDVSIEIETEENYFESCAPFPGSGCEPDSTTIETFPDSASAPGPDPFEATAARPEFPNTFATQDSEILNSSIQATGSHKGISDYYDFGGFPITYHSETHDTHTRALVTFEIDAPSAYELRGSVTTEGEMFSSSSSRISLTRPAGVVLAEVMVLSDPNCVSYPCRTVGPELLEAAGWLEPGTYTLEAIASGQASGIHSMIGTFGSIEGGEFEVDLQLSAPVPVLPWLSRVLLALALLATATLRRSR